MEIQIENLKAKMRGVELNSYQKGLALDEFKKPLNAYNVLTALRSCRIEKFNY